MDKNYVRRNPKWKPGDNGEEPYLKTIKPSPKKEKMKILNIKEPISKYPSSYDCYEITVDFGNGKPYVIYKNRLGYEVFKLEQELLNMGIDPDLLDKYRSAIIDETEFDSNQD